jgi:hypothetical protein
VDFQTFGSAVINKTRLQILGALVMLRPVIVLTSVGVSNHMYALRVQMRLSGVIEAAVTSEQILVCLTHMHFQMA